VPTKVGTFDFLAGATDGQGNSPTKGFTIVIVAGPLVLGDPSATLAVGTPANIGLHVTGGVTPYRFALGCALPAGLTFGAAGITGTPTTPGTTGCRYTVTDSVGATASKDFTITVVAQSITFTGGPLPPAQVGVSYTAQVTAQGGNPPFTYTGNGLPEGLSVSSTGGISGTPATPGSTSFSVTVTDTNRTAATATFTIVIAPAPLSGGAAALPDGVVGIAYSATLPASGGVRPYTALLNARPM